MMGAFEGYGKRIIGWACTGLTVLFGVQLLRMLFSSLVGYLRDAQGIDALSLAPIALAIFAASFLAALLRRAAGTRRAIWISAGGVGLVRLLEQVSSSPSLDLILSAVGVALFLLYIPIGLGASRAKADGTTQWGYGFLLGMALDSGIHIAACTLDLSWRPGIIPLVIVALLVVALFVAVRATASEPSRDSGGEGSWSRCLPLLVFGPWLFLQLLVFQNTARVSALTGWATPAAGTLVVLGNVLGLAVGSVVTQAGRRRVILTVACGLLLVSSLSMPEPRGFMAVVMLLVGQVLSLVLGLVIFGGVGQGDSRPGLLRTTVSAGGGQILFVLITFLYYVAYDLPLGLRAQVLLPAAAIIVGIGAVAAGRGHSPQKSAVVELRPALAALVLLCGPLFLALTWRTPQALQPDPANSTVRVIDYNLHNGFNTSGRLDLEALAEIIEASDADVVGLQEVSRGWLIWGSADMLAWLSQRLDMEYVSGPTSDAQWGNAVLSRYPILRVETHPLPPDSLLIRRGYIIADIDVGQGSLRVINTHFHHVVGDSEIREVQSRALMEGWGGTSATVIVGDLNAPPESAEMVVLSGLGLVNVVAELVTPPVYTYPADEPSKQIDYIWTSPDLAYSDGEVLRTKASDHLPLVATITLP
jgi:endonuclease/exonuclease/phosphatase family metal-dependent hydrolase